MSRRVNRHTTPKRHGGKRPLSLAALLIIAAGATAGACSDGSAAKTATRRGALQARNVDEMMRAKFHHQACHLDDDCPLGTHCNGESVCDYECVSDEACGSGQGCSDRGECGPSITLLAEVTTSPSCAAKSHDEIVAALEELAVSDDPPKCHTDANCICGAFCNTDSGFCQVECVDGSTSGNLVCTDPTLPTCNTVGRCVAASNPGPSPQLLLQMAPDPVSANSFSAPVLIPVSVSVDAVTVDVAVSPHPAPVRYHFVGIDDPQLPADPSDPPPDPATLPKVKCAAGDTLATSCTIDGGWTFDPTHNGLHSATKTIWVQIPRSTIGATWTLQATSEWAADPKSVTVQAAPVTPSPPVPGHYTGTLQLTSGGVPVATKVDALVTDTKVAILDPSKSLLADGHAVFSRDASKVTMLGWLSSGTGGAAAHYDVRIQLGALVQDPGSGHLEFPGSTLTLGETAPAGLSLSLDRTGELDAPTCAADSDCPAPDPAQPDNDEYCDVTFGRCLLGTGPAAGAGIVDATSASATPTVTLPSAQLTAWGPSLATLAAQHPGTLHPGIGGIESAYCAHTSGDQAPPQFNVTATIAGAPGNTDGASLDRECHLGTDYVQPTFPFADRTNEFIQAAQAGQDFSLVDVCSGELGAAPSATLSSATCVSPGRFFLALSANVAAGEGVPGGRPQQRLVWQILRQWLGLNTYVASTNVRLQPYHDVVDATSEPRSTSLGNAVDRMEQSLMVLLDPMVRPQFAEGDGLAAVVTAPDYRVAPRPVAHWTFNNLNQTTISTYAAPDVEGGNALSLTYSGDTQGRITLQNSDLQSSGFGGSRTCTTSAPVALDEQHFSIVASLNFVPFNGVTTVLFDKVSASGQHLTLQATTADWGQHVTFTLLNPGAGGATFVIPWQPANWGRTTFFAVVADGETYSMYVANPVAQPAISAFPAGTVTGDGPRWGDPGTVALACASVGAAACSSYDRLVPGDHQDITPTNSVTFSATNHFSCIGSNCQGTAQSPAFCNTTAQQTRASYVASLTSMGVPSTFITPMTVTGSVNVISTSSFVDENRRVNTSTDWNCALNVQSYPSPIFNFKPVCGSGGLWDEWDEVSLWTQPLTLGQFTDMVGRYNFTPTNDSVPAPTDSFDPKDEQRAGLPVYLVEAANAHLDLLAHYVAAEADVVYGDCYANRTSSELPVARARAGRNLRLALVLQHEATRLAALADPSATWLPRYQIDVQQFATRVSQVRDELARLATCRNTLNISDDEIPLYVGEGKDTSPGARFFAASDYLVGLAENETLAGHGAAALLRDQARSAYISQRLSSFQTNAGDGSDEKKDRVNALTVNYEDQLRQYCGAAPGDLTLMGGHPLLDGLRSGTLTATTCYLKLEDRTNCSVDINGNALDENTPFAAIPDKCIRGRMGERVIAIKSAAVDSDNAMAARDRAQKQYDVQMDYCDKQVQTSADDANEDLANHIATMNDIAKAREAFAILGAISKTVVGIAASTAKGGAGAPGAFGSLGEGAAGIGEAVADQQAEKENLSYQKEIVARQGQDQVNACKQIAKEQFFSISAAEDATKRAAEESVAAVFALNDDLNTVAAIVGEASSQLDFENTIDRTPPQFHYWLDQTIADYQRHMAYARRLTYLALRAYEYEAQVDTGKRSLVLNARVPEDLESVVTDIKNHSAPFAGGGIDPKPFSNVFSIRDEILKLQPSSGKSAAQLFNELLMANPVFVGTGVDRHLFGYAIPFSLKTGESWNDVLCDERSWRITPLVSATGGLPTDKTVVLGQTNSFGSQVCTATHPMKITRIRQNVNLLSGDELANFATPDSTFRTPIFLNLGNSTSDVSLLANLPDTDSRLDASMAGRGLYGDYTLVIPLCDPAQGCTTGYTTSKLATVTDVLIRLDVAAGSNTAGLPTTLPVFE